MLCSWKTSYLCYILVAVGITTLVIFYPGSQHMPVKMPAKKAQILQQGIYDVFHSFSNDTDGTEHSTGTRPVTHSSTKSTHSSTKFQVGAVIDGPSQKIEDCKKKVHAEYLSPKELADWTKRSAKGCAMAKCQFMNRTNRLSVPLVSFPGSWNTWTRGLLEKATEICTGAIFHDTSLSGKGLVGEGLTSSVVVAVKMHGLKFSRLSPKGVLDRMLLIVRNPFDALVAEYNRQKGHGHKGTVGSSLFGNNNTWNSYIPRMSAKWKDLIVSAVNSSRNSTLKLHIIRFEDLKTDKVAAMARVLDFLDFEYDKEDLEKRLQEDYSTFKRAHPQEFEHYTEEQKQLVNETISSLIASIKKLKFTEKLDFLSDYLRS